MTCNPACLQAFSRRIRVITAVVSAFVLTSASHAQWPVSYQDPLIIGNGVDCRAGSIKATPSGSVIVAVDAAIGGIRQIDGKHFNAAGEQLFTSFDVPYAQGQRILKLQVVEPTAGTDLSCDIVCNWARSDLDLTDYTAAHIWISRLGSFAGMYAYRDRHLMTEVTTGDGTFGAVLTGPWAGTMRYDLGTGRVAVPVPMGDRLVDFRVVASGEASYLASYTRLGPQVDGPSEVWLAGVNRRTDGTVGLLGPFVADNLPNQQQGHSQITDMGGAFMLTWLTEEYGQTNLYGKVVNSLAGEVSPPQRAIDNLEDYVATSSTLGIPVFAAVQHDGVIVPPVDRLLGGLINPSNGGTLTIPIAEGPDVKVKDLRQLADGNFRLTYSILDGDTHLLKVRNISGVTAGTLWETTVADVGRTSDKVLEHYPNAHVASNGDGVLYILARHDRPGTANCQFQVVRLRADGSMGGD